MDFLKDLAMPQSQEHFRLLLFMLNLIYIVFVPYAAFLLGAAALALREEVRGREKANAFKVRFARDLMDVVMVNKSVPTFLGVLPALSLVFLYAQLLQRTPAIAVGLATLGFLLFFASCVLLYAYKYTFDLGSLLDTLMAGHGGTKDAKNFATGNAHAHDVAGRWGVVLGFVAMFLLTSAVAITVNPALWTSVGSVFGLFVTPDVYVKFLLFVAMSLGMTGLGILFFFFGWEGGRGLDGEYASYARKKGIDLGATALLAQPALILASLLFLPSTTLSGTMVGLSAVAVLLLLLALQMLYAYQKEGRAVLAGYVFFTLVVASAFTVTKDQLAIQNATKEHAASMVVAHEMHIAELKAKIGVGIPSPSGEDIYNGRCSACHLYDQKKVGPPYNVVVPKYAGKKEAMIAFVLNPVKVDPAYPNMPNQGLKPAEADSIVSYLFRKMNIK